jgi:hypothetical protein
LYKASILGNELQEFSPAACDLPENILMECVRTLALRCASIGANLPLFPENRFSGAGEGIRTPDPLITNQMLYRLSYASNRKHGPSRHNTSCPRLDNYLRYHTGFFACNQNSPSGTGGAGTDPPRVAIGLEDRFSDRLGKTPVFFVVVVVCFESPVRPPPLWGCFLDAIRFAILEIRWLLPWPTHARGEYPLVPGLDSAIWIHTFGSTALA